MQGVDRWTSQMTISLSKVIILLEDVGVDTEGPESIFGFGEVGLLRKGGGKFRI